MIRMHRVHRYLCLSIIAFAAIAPVASLGTKDSASVPPEAMPAKETVATPMQIRVGALKGPTGIGMIYLFETPPVLPSGDTVKVEAIASVDAMAARLMSGELDAAVLPVNMAAKLYNAGLPYRLLAVVGNGMVKIVTTDPSLGSLADLPGREVYVAGQGATPEFLMRTILRNVGMDPDKDVSLVFNMPYPEMAAGIVSGKVQTAVLPEPFATLALRGNKAARIPFSLDAAWNDATGRPHYPMSVFVAHGDVIDGHGPSIEAVMDAYEASITKVVESPLIAGELVQKHDMGLAAPMAAAAIPQSAYTFVRAPEARTDLEALLRVFLGAAPASIGGRLPDALFYAVINK